MADGESFYDEIEIEDMTFDSALQIYHYPCPCGDRFEISLSDLRDGEDVGVCPSCSLMIKVIYDMVGILKESRFNRKVLMKFIGRSTQRGRCGRKDKRRNEAADSCSSLRR